MADPGAELGGQGDAFNPLLLYSLSLSRLFFGSPLTPKLFFHIPPVISPLLPTILLALDFTSLSA